MDAEIKQKWLVALRSGNYTQGHGLLHKGDTFCCLGVLCDAAKLGKWEDHGEDPEGPHWYAHFDAMRNNQYPAADDLLPETVRDTIGLTGVQQEKCWKMNDEQGASFAEIADFIEREL